MCGDLTRTGGVPKADKRSEDKSCIGIETKEKLRELICQFEKIK
jgi:hypothetical protein